MKKLTGTGAMIKYMIVIIVILALGLVAVLGYGIRKKQVQEKENLEQIKEDADISDVEEVAKTTEASDGAENSSKMKNGTGSASGAEAKKATEHSEDVVEEAPLLEAEIAAPTPQVEKKLIAIDAGHQAHGNSEQEPIGPGASQTKAKVASGTTGRSTGIPEYELNLEVSLKLKEELLARGYDVYMIRETHEVDISNAQRAQMAAKEGSEILIRIHANGSDNTSVAGALTMAPSLKNPYLSQQLIEECQRLSQCVITSFCKVTGANNQGVYQTDEMSGLNWCSIPATIVELGYMTNKEEDENMATDAYQEEMVRGIADGIDAYFTS